MLIFNTLKRREKSVAENLLKKLDAENIEV